MSIFRILALLSLSAFPISGTAAELLGDRERGRELFVQCQGCHEVGKGAEDRIGPHLNGIFGKSAGASPGFRYSDAMARAGSDGLRWDADTLDIYIENPKSLVSKTRMTFPGIKDPQERADILAYLRIFSDNPRDIPEAEPTARATDHEVDPAILAIQGDPAYGEYLSSECITCHQRDGSAEGIPSITLWPVEDFVVVMHAYKQKKRPHPVMRMVAGRLSAEEIAALAAYFANAE